MIEDKRQYNKNIIRKNSVYGCQNISDHPKIQTHKYTYVDGKIVRIDN